MKLPVSAITAMAFRFEEVNGRQHGPEERAEMDVYGLSGMDPEFLVGELRRLIDSERHTDPITRGQAYWALGKKVDPSLLPFFREKLRLELGRDMFATYQILIALDDLEEQPFGQDRSGYGVHEHDLNRRDAMLYLNRVDTNL